MRFKRIFFKIINSIFIIRIFKDLFESDKKQQNKEIKCSICKFLYKNNNQIEKIDGKYVCFFCIAGSKMI